MLQERRGCLASTRAQMIACEEAAQSNPSPVKAHTCRPRSSSLVEESAAVSLLMLDRSGSTSSSTSGSDTATSPPRSPSRSSPSPSPKMSGGIPFRQFPFPPGVLVTPVQSDGRAGAAAAAILSASSEEPKSPKPTSQSSEAHACPQCHKKFISQSKLRRHMLVHSGDKPFHCGSCCGTRFTQKSALKVHLKRKLREKFNEEAFTRLADEQMNEWQRKEAYAKSAKFEQSMQAGLFLQSPTMPQMMQAVSPAMVSQMNSNMLTALASASSQNAQTAATDQNGVSPMFFVQMMPTSSYGTASHAGLPGANQTHRK